MPVMVPLRSDLKRTPTSSGVLSPESTRHGVTALPIMPHGQAMSTETLAGLDSRLPVSSTARAITVARGAPWTTQLYDHDVVPVAGCHVAPPSTDTSTPATVPPVSVAVPLT